MTRKELIEKLQAVGTDESEVQDLFGSEEPLEIYDVQAGREVAGDEEFREVDQEIIFIMVRN